MTLAVCAAVLWLAAVARAAPAATAPIAYGPDPAETVMVLPAASAPATATVMFVHGGYWRTQPDSHWQGLSQMEELQSQDDATVVLVRYPQVCVKPVERCGLQETEAVLRAYRWTREHVASYGGNPANVQLLGSSAGGQLVERAADALEAEPSPGLGSVAELSAPGLNLATFVPSIFDGETDRAGASATARYLDCGDAAELETCFATPAAQERAFEESPINAIPAPVDGSNPACVPQSISWGEVNDPVSKEQSIEYAGALEAAGCPVVREPGPRSHAMKYWAYVKYALYGFWNAH